MKVAKDRVVSLAYQLRAENDVLVNKSQVSASLEYLHDYGSLIPGLEKRWKTLPQMAAFDISIETNDAYGPYVKNLVQ